MRARASSEFYTLSLHDALPISVLFCKYYPAIGRAPTHSASENWRGVTMGKNILGGVCDPAPILARARSEEHTSELQSLTKLVCRLLLEKKNQLPTVEHSIPVRK